MTLPRLNKSHKVFDVNEELPDQYVISVCTTLKALESVKPNKATRPGARSRSQDVFC